MPKQDRFILRVFPMGWLETNCYLFREIDSKHAIIIDPGAPDLGLLQTIQSEDLEIKAIINTHGHADHIAGNRFFQEATQAPLFIHGKDRPMLLDPALNFSQTFGTKITSPDANQVLEQGFELQLGGEPVEVIETPGHSPGSVCIRIESFLFSGDTLFRESIGRTDIPGGNIRTILHSIHKQLLSLPEETLVFPGHGPQTSIGNEKRQNPFLRKEIIF
ncbi:MBL fold metallo-hydrolase [bacterium]|nr:MBL fold metallo-hydrolase [bacterium]